ncbi:hypothetical protein [Nannocystis pusilla]|uniref:hypothetical protein n=1 Tax=Nannocystis pusilla TaxID=889268 RepID=UPI003DA3AAE1
MFVDRRDLVALAAASDRAIGLGFSKKMHRPARPGRARCLVRAGGAARDAGPCSTEVTHMANFTLRILPVVLFVAAASAACDEEPVALDRSEAAPVVEAATATAVLARGVTDYVVTREAAGARVALRGASELGDLTAQTVAPGVVRLQLDWQGRALEFEVDTTQTPAPLTIRTGGRTAVVHAEGADDPAARALFAEVQGEWELARAAFVEARSGAGPARGGRAAARRRRRVLHRRALAQPQARRGQRLPEHLPSERVRVVLGPVLSHDADRRRAVSGGVLRLR